MEGLADGVTVDDCGSSPSLSPLPSVGDNPLLPQGNLLCVSDLVTDSVLDLDLDLDPDLLVVLDLVLDLGLDLDLDDDLDMVGALLFV